MAVVAQQLVLAQRSDQVAAVQGRRPKVVDDPPHVGDGDRHLTSEVLDKLGQVRRLRQRPSQLHGGRVEPEPHTRQRRPDAVVQVLAQARPLVLRRGDDLLAGLAQLRGERGRVHGHRDRSGKDGEHRDVLGVSGSLGVRPDTTREPTSSPA